MMIGLIGSFGFTGCIGTAHLSGSGMSSRRITVDDVEESPSGYPVELSAKMVDETATSDDPAQVQVTLTNRGDRSIDISTGWPKVFGSLVSEETDPGLLLVPPEHAPKRNPKCPQPSGSYDIPSSLWMTSLDPGVSTSVTFEVWGQSNNDSSDCLPEGTYTFKSKYNVGSDDSKESFRWGFSLDVVATE